MEVEIESNLVRKGWEKWNAEIERSILAASGVQVVAVAVKISSSEWDVPGDQSWWKGHKKIFRWRKWDWKESLWRLRCGGEKKWRAETVPGKEHRSKGQSRLRDPEIDEESEMGKWGQEQIEQCMNYWENNCLFCLLFLLLVRLRVVGEMGSSSKRLKLPEKDDLWG